MVTADTDLHTEADSGSHCGSCRGTKRQRKTGQAKADEWGNIHTHVQHKEHDRKLASKLLLAWAKAGAELTRTRRTSKRTWVTNETVALMLKSVAQFNTCCTVRNEQISVLSILDKGAIKQPLEAQFKFPAAIVLILSLHDPNLEPVKFILTPIRAHALFPVSFPVQSFLPPPAVSKKIGLSWSQLSMKANPPQMMCNWKEKLTCHNLSTYDYLRTTSFTITQFSISSFCPKQFSFLADCFIALALCPINKHLHSHDSDKWKPPLNPNEIVYPQELLRWKYEKRDCPGIYHILPVQCQFEIIKWLCDQFCISSLFSSSSHTHVLRNHLVSGRSTTHSFLGLWCTPRWRQARSQLWCRSADWTCICSKAPNHAGSTWWCRGCWCPRSVAVPLRLCRWLNERWQRCINDGNHFQFLIQTRLPSRHHCTNITKSRTER